MKIPELLRRRKAEEKIWELEQKKEEKTRWINDQADRAGRREAAEASLEADRVAEAGQVAEAG